MPKVLDNQGRTKTIVSNLQTNLNSSNLLYNGGLDFFQRQAPATAKAMTDDVYNGPDRWYSLIQGANPTCERLAGTDGSSFTIKLISGGTTNRFGIAQIVESVNSVPMQSRSIRLQCRVRANKNAGSGSINVRCVILEWTGTADVVTSDFVNDWTSSTYTTGNFFTATSTTVVGTARISASHNVWTDLNVTGVVSNSCKNLAVMVWNEDVPAHASDFIEIGKVGLYDGTSAIDWLPRPIQEELALCQRYYEKSYDVDTVPGTVWSAGSAMLEWAHTVAIFGASISFQVKKRATPTLTLYDAAGNSGKLSYYNGSWNNNGTPGQTYANQYSAYGQHGIANTNFTNFAITVEAEL